jgi:hypothetical protein
MFSKAKKEAGKDPLVKKLDELLWVRGFARSLNISTLIASAGGNVLHAEKRIVPVILSLLAPLALMGAFELLSRVPIRKGSSWLWLVVRIGATAGIASCTAWISYFHQRDGIYAETGDMTLARLLPAVIDFLMIVSAGTLIELNIQIRDLEAAIAGIKVRTEKPVEKAPDKPLSKKAVIAQMWSRFPQLPIEEIAEKASASYNYTASVIDKLRKASATQSQLETV